MNGTPAFTHRRGARGESRVAGVLLAAGESRRFGGDKLLEPLRGKPVLRRSLDTLLASSLPRVVVVLGARAGARLAAIEDVVGERVRVVLVEGRGRASSVRAGLSACDGFDWAAFALADMPFLRPSTVGALLRAVERSAPERIVAPTYQGKRGHPACFHRELWGALRALAGDASGNDLIEREGYCAVPCDDEGALRDVDHPSDLERCTSSTNG